jgi:glucose-6-phosphate isomerase
MIKVDLSRAVSETHITAYQEEVHRYHHQISHKVGLGSDFLGWVRWPFDYDVAEYDRLKLVAQRIRQDADVFVVCGIGGSYLGARAAIEMIQGLFKREGPEIIYLGNTFSSTYIMEALKYLDGKSVYVNVISKSGTTTETAMAFRLLKQHLEARYGSEGARQRIIATTDSSKGTLNALAVRMGYEMFSIPDDIGGRYSVLTSVGLLPIAVAGIDVDAMLKGAQAAAHAYQSSNLNQNDAYRYAVARRVLNQSGKSTELLVTYEAQLTMMAEWWKQLFGESEGKEGRGLFPASVNFSTDLHSMGQFVQEGTPLLFETLVWIERAQADMRFPTDAQNLDGMNYLAGKGLHEVNRFAALGTLQAHHESAKIPVIELTLEDLSSYSFGYMAQFFFLACGMSVYLLGVNPFDQPGVEVYKKNMFKLLGKE